MPDHRYVNDERTVLVWVRDDGTVQVALRSEPAATWGPPIACPVEGNQPPTIADVRGAAALALEHAEKGAGRALPRLADGRWSSGRSLRADA